MSSLAHVTFPTPAEDEVVILHASVALDRLEVSVTQRDHAPHERREIPKQNVTGTIVRIGENVARFTFGQRVLAYIQHPKAQIALGDGTQPFSTVSQALVSTVPDSLDFQEVATLPLSITLAAVGLYQRNHLNLPLPQAKPEHTGKTILVLDGASEIGSLVLQLAVASGVRVIATASSPNMSLVESLGASIVIEEGPIAQEELIATLNTSKIPLVGIFDMISTDSSFAQIDALLQHTAQTPPVCAINPPAHPPKFFAPTIAISSTINRKPYAHVQTAIWGDYLPEALRTGRLKINPVQTVVKVRQERADSAVDAIPL